MSLTRKASKGTLRLTTEDFSSCMDQKNSIITSLQGEVETLRVNQEKYDRVKEELIKAKNRLEYLLRDHDTTLSNNQERLELSARSVYELRIQAEHLQEEMRLRSQALKEAKFSTQQLVDYENRKEDEATEIKIKLQEQRSLSQVRKMQEERTRLQISQMREQVEKGRRQNAINRNQNESVNEKCYKTQSYIRNLLREESNLNENLSRVQDENNKLDFSISEMDTVVSVNNSEISNKEKDCQELQFKIASKQLQKKKLENQVRERVKQLSAQKQKWRALCEQWEAKKMEAARMDSQLGEASQDINFIMSKNNEIQEVNEQLNEDLKVCQRHLENVVRINKTLDTQIQGLHATNLKTISKLQQPFSNRTNMSNPVNATGKWGASSRVTDYETGDFEKRSCR